MLSRRMHCCARTFAMAIAVVAATFAFGTVTAASAAGTVFWEQSCLQGVTPNAPNCTFDAALGSPIALAVSADGRFLYVGGEAGNQAARLQVFGPKGSGGFQRIQCLTGDFTDSTRTFE